MHILVLEAYDGGSHGQFLDGLIGASRHRFTRLGLPARKWKWRMRGSAIHFAEQLAADLSAGVLDANQIDLIFTSDMTAVADLRALLPKVLRDKPILCYFHENQLTYPLPNEDDRDYQYGFTNITSCLAADAVWFNSRYHWEDFLAASRRLLAKMPDFVPQRAVETIEQKGRVMPLGVADHFFAAGARSRPGRPPTLLWNHRWEYDKDPDAFFEAIFDLHRAEVDFRLIVLGQCFRQAPPIFDAAKKLLAEKLVHFGYVEGRSEYLRLMSQANVVVSTARQEFFGLSVVEAMAAGCYPLLPRRLSYPELLPPELQEEHLYDNAAALRQKLTTLCQNGVGPLPPPLVEHVAQWSWPTLITRYDEAFENILRDHATE